MISPFLATGGTLIHVHKGKLIFRVGDECLTFNINGHLKSPKNKILFSVNNLEVLVDDYRKNTNSEHSIEILHN